jgi:hypothetical protein
MQLPPEAGMFYGIASLASLQNSVQSHFSKQLWLMAGCAGSKPNFLFGCNFK